MTKPKKYLRKKALAERYSMTERSIDRMCRDGRLPVPIYRGRIPLWDEAELDKSDRLFAVAGQRV